MTDEWAMYAIVFAIVILGLWGAMAWHARCIRRGEQQEISDDEWGV